MRWSRHTGVMGTPIAIVVAGALIAIAIAITFRWEVTGGPLTTFHGVGPQPIYRLDRWTGTVVQCTVSPNALKIAIEPHSAPKQGEIQWDEWKPVMQTCD